MTDAQLDALWEERREMEREQLGAAARQTCLLANIHRDRRTRPRPYSEYDFLPERFRPAPQPRTVETTRREIAVFSALARAASKK